MSPILLDARSLQLASEVLGPLEAKALLQRRPFPEEPQLEEDARRTLTTKLVQLLSGEAEAHPLSAAELDALVRCCRGSEAPHRLEEAPWPHAWRYEPLFLHLAEHRPDTAAACRRAVAAFLLPQVQQTLQGMAARSTGETRGGPAFPPSLFAEERERGEQQLAALQALWAPPPSQRVG